MFDAAQGDLRYVARALLLENECDGDDDARPAPLGRIESGALDASDEASDDLVTEGAPPGGGRGSHLAVRPDLCRDLHRPLQIRVGG